MLLIIYTFILLNFFFIGKRFAEVEMKLALVEILSKFEVEPCEKTEIPIQFSKLSVVAIPKDEKLWLKLIPLNE